MYLKCSDIDFNIINKLLGHFSESVFHLNSTRAFPPREFEVGIGIPLAISPDGTGTAETIWNLSEMKSESYLDINDWLISICGREIDTEYPPISIKKW